MAGTLLMEPWERVLWECVSEGNWEGDVQAPSGAFTTLMLDGVESEWSLVPGATARLAREEELTMEELASINYDELNGLWIIREDDQGNVEFHKFNDYVKLTAALSNLRALWAVND